MQCQSTIIIVQLKYCQYYFLQKKNKPITCYLGCAFILMLGVDSNTK